MEKMFSNEVVVLGSVYQIVEQTAAENPLFEDSDGYCDWTVRQIHIRREIEGTLCNMERYMKKVLRHEIVHAFLLESGLDCCTTAETWARNEEMVDWLARQGEKIYAAWSNAGALEDTK